MSVPLAGGTATTVATFSSAFNGVPGHRVRREERLLGEQLRVRGDARSHHGRTAVTISCDREKPEGIAQDATHVYWTTEGGSVKSLPK